MEWEIKDMDGKWKCVKIVHFAWMVEENENDSGWMSYLGTIRVPCHWRSNTRVVAGVSPIKDSRISNVWFMHSLRNLANSHKASRLQLPFEPIGEDGSAQ